MYVEIVAASVPLFAALWWPETHVKPIPNDRSPKFNQRVRDAGRVVLGCVPGFILAQVYMHNLTPIWAAFWVMVALTAYFVQDHAEGRRAWSQSAEDALADIEHKAELAQSIEDGLARIKAESPNADIESMRKDLRRSHGLD